ncbi:MAG TPA: DnaJ C-terminal domain-containing protein [Candidatus Polarisedimenticolia bacterium]|jgi:molecular chaperone DnaJ
MKKDYFAILGLKPTATDKEIRSAYKRLAKKFHPDVNPNNKKSEEKFKEIGEAYEVLSDPEKRRKWETGDLDYESYFRSRSGRAGGPTGQQPPFTAFEFGDAADLGGIFSELFRGMGGAAGGRGASARGAGARARRAFAGSDLEYETSVSFEDAVRGATLKIPLARTVTCPVCGGLGEVRRGAASGKMVMEPCSACSGVGRQRVTETIQVRIPPGVEDGGRVKVAGKGEAGEGGGPDGDLYVVLRVTPHPWFRREGREIILDLPLSVAEAALGTRLEVPTIGGRVTLTIPPGTSSGQKLRLKGRGIASRDGAAKGDQIVIPQIVTPKTLDPKSRQLLEEFDRLNPTRPREGLGW